MYAPMSNASPLAPPPLKEPNSPHKDDAVIAVFESQHDLEEAVTELCEKGFSKDDISTQQAHDGKLLDEVQKLSSKVVEAALVGMAVGAFSGGLMGLAWPFAFIGSDLSARIATAIASAAACGLAGSIAGAVVGLNMPEYRKENYETNLREGQIVLQIVARDSEELWLAQDIIRAHQGRVLFPERIFKQAG